MEEEGAESVLWSRKSSPGLFLLLAVRPPARGWLWINAEHWRGAEATGVSDLRLGFVLSAPQIAPQPMTAKASAPRGRSKETQGDRAASAAWAVFWALGAPFQAQASQLLAFVSANPLFPTLFLLSFLSPSFAEHPLGHRN